MSATDPFSTQNALLPEQFGKYSLLAHLATGGMAEVWLARQLGMQGFEKIVVIKRARPELSTHETTAMFLDEARLVAALEHPNIAQVYEIGAVNGSYFFVMEYVDGADLRRLIETSLAKRRRIELADALYIITHVCTALHYAHEKHDLDGRPLHIIHRDVSPSNVLISYDGVIKVCDFGIAKAHGRKSENTQSGVLKGKFSYMSPEQCQSKPLDRRSDVFSIGILLYELSTLSKLFRAPGDLAVLQQIVEGEVPRPSTRVSGYPPQLERIVMRALAKAPGDRYPTAQALQLDLEAFAREHRLATSSVPIAKLMNDLFDKRNDAWIRAQRTHSDHFIEIDQAGNATNAPPFIAVGSAPLAPGNEVRQNQATEVLRSQSSVSRAIPPVTSLVGTGASGATMQGPARRSGALWLVGVGLSIASALGVTVADRLVAGAGERAIATAITAAAERVALTFDAAARSVHIRADGIATTPMLRAAIETDAATLRDLASNEMGLTADKGEALEVFQLHDDQPVSMLRMPKTAASLPALEARATQFHSDGHGVTVLASAPISGYRSGLAGRVVMSVPVDLTTIARGLDDHILGASLTGFGPAIVLVAGTASRGTTARTLAIASSSDWNSAGVALTAIVKPVTGATWAKPAQYVSVALAALLLVGFITGLVRRPRS